MDATAALVAEHGLTAVTMSEIAADRDRPALASFCLHALTAAALPSTAAVHRLVTVTAAHLQNRR